MCIPFKLNEKVVKNNLKSCSIVLYGRRNQNIGQQNNINELLVILFNKNNFNNI